MRLVLQRVKRASVSVDGRVVTEIGSGIVALVGVDVGDTMVEAHKLAAKTAQVRVFEDEAGKMNLSVGDVDGEVLAVPNFTLCAACGRGRRPDFTRAASPLIAAPLFDRFCEVLAAEGLAVRKGLFGAHMVVELRNDGPVTIILEAKGAVTGDS